MIAVIADYSPNTVQILAIVAAALFAVAVLSQVLTPVARLVKFLVPEDLPGHPVVVAAGLCVLAVAVIFLV